MYSRLFELIRKEEVVLFVGAGFSINAGYPSGENLCKRIFENLSDTEKIEINKNLQLPELTEEFVQIRGNSRNSLISILKEIYSKSAISLSDHEKVKSIPHFSNIITTNYDTLFETVYKESCNVIFKDEHCTYIDKSKANIFKIHGDLSDPNSVIITKSDYTHFFDSQKQTIFWNKIKDIIATYNVLFIGYSFEDNNIISIVEKIKVSLGLNTKEMFLIAPNWKDYKSQRLTTFGVRYFDDYACNFFDLLTENIKSHINEDYEQKKVSSETLNKFCVNYNISLDLNLSNDKNQIVNIKSLNNQPIESKFTFTVNEKIANQINNGEFSEGELPIKIKGNDISSYPRVKIPVEEILEFQYRVNDIVFSSKENISNLYIVKLPNKKGELDVKTPDNDLFSNIKYELFVKNNFESTFKAYTLLFNLTINFKKEKSSNKLNVNWQTEFKDTYRNNITAIYWSKLLIKLYSGGKFSFYLDGHELTYDIPFIEVKDEVIENLKTHINYYQNVEEIEKLRKIKFNIYSRFTERNYEYSKIVLLYSKKEFELIPAKNYKSSFEFLGDEAFTNLIEGNPDSRFFLFQTSKLQEPIILNSYKFNVRYKNIIYEKCKILNVLVKENGSYYVEFENEGDYIQVSYTENAIRQEGLEIRFFD